MGRRILSLLLCLLLLPLPALAEETALTDEEITRLLWEMYQTENGDADYMVLPEEYELPAEGKSGIYHLLLLGIDSPTEKIAGRSDTMVLACFNARTGRLKLISFLRDTYVAIPGHGHNKLNAAYSYGGADLLIQTLGASFGVRVDGYVAVNYTLMAALVDAIGGIQLEVTAAERRKLNGILEYYNYLRDADRKEGLLAEDGLQTLNGLQTMSYSRIRKLDSDFVRVQRQQKVLLAIYQKLRSLDMLTLSRVITAYIGQVDTNVTLAQGASLAASVLAYDDLDIQTLRVPVDKAFNRTTLNETYYVVPKLDACREAIQAFLDGD